jgi:hypothetical protein
MADLKLAKLLDRTPVKLSTAITPDLQNAVQQYAALYAQSYGNEEPVVGSKLNQPLENLRAH